MCFKLDFNILKFTLKSSNKDTVLNVLIVIF
jgi:hypothetical protein